MICCKTWKSLQSSSVGSSPSLPVQRGNVSLTNLQFVNAILYVAEHGCKWRGLAQTVRQLAHDLYAHESLGEGRLYSTGSSRSCTSADCAHQDRGVALDSPRQGTSRWHRRSKKNGPQAIGKSRGGWNTKIHMVAADARTALTFSLTPGKRAMRPRDGNCCEARPMPEWLRLLDGSCVRGR